MNESKRWYKRKWFKVSVGIYVGFMVVAVIIGALFGEEETASIEPEVQAEKKSEAKAEPVAQPVVNEPPTIESIVRDAVGDNYVSHESEEGVLYIDMILADNLTADMAVKSAYDRIVEMSEQILDNELLGDNTAVHYFFAADLTDAYGNVTSQNVLGVKLSAETLAKINFDNFSIDNLPTIADAHFRHAALNK